MSTTDELLEEMLEDAEEYATPVTDDDLQFWIDEHLRVISIPKNGVVAGVEGDKNVNKIKFGMNRYYHGFDMSTFSGRILYSNAKGNKNYYNITDMQTNGNTITFSWLVDADAVQYMGKTAFVVYLFKTQGSELRQKFYSTLATLNVLEGMEVDSAVPVEKQTDIIERMKEEISAYAEEVKKSLPADYTAMTEQVSSLKEDLSEKYTQVNNELTDMRTDGDNITYESAGETIRIQFANVNRKLDESKDSEYIYDTSGNKYTLEIDENGNLYARRMYDVPSDGVILDLQITKEHVFESKEEKVYSEFPINESGEYFSGDFVRYSPSTTGTDLLKGETLNDYTIIAYLYPSENIGGYFIGDTQNDSGINVNKSSKIRLKYHNCILPTGSDTTLGFIGNVAPYAKIKKQTLASMNSDMIIMFGKESSSKTIRTMINDLVSEKTYSIENNGLKNLRLNSLSKFKRIVIYDRLLSSEEMEQAYSSFQFDNIVNYGPITYIRGIKGLGCPTAIKCKNNSLPEWDNEVKDFDEIERSEADVIEDMSSYTDLIFINPISKIEIGKMYNLEAMVYPYNVLKNSYNVEYSSLNPDILECYSGVLIPKKIGTAQIMAKISNTDISAIQEIEVIEENKAVENFCYISETYSYGLDALNSKNPISVLKAIIGAIKEVSDAGYNGIVFPKMDYHIKPFQHDSHCTIPSDFTIDFQNSAMYVEDNEYCTSAINKGYNFFQFGKYDFDSDPIRIPCHNSTVKNLYYYGERWNTEHEDGYYSEFVTAFKFSTADVYNCHLENIVFNSTVGFNVGFDNNSFQQWQGTSNDGAVRGCVRYSDFSAGKLSDDGTSVEENPGWYCTPEYLKLGFSYDATDYTGMKKYKVGQMNAATTYGLSSRWYEIYFFDESKELIDYRIHQMTLETYDLPEKAVYFKINAMFDSAPTTDAEGKVDVPHVIRLWTSSDPDQCYIDNCKFINPHACAIAVTGGTNCVIRNCYAEQGAIFRNPSGAVFGWSIDYEDGWQAMRHNILYKTMCNGYVTMPGGHNTAVIDCIIQRLTSSYDTELITAINSVFQSVDITSKTNLRLENAIYGSLKTKLKTDVATIRNVNCLEQGVNIF